jgi:fructose-specific phosphotransferase system IIC component
VRAIVPTAILDVGAIAGVLAGHLRVRLEVPVKHPIACPLAGLEHPVTCLEATVAPAI